MALLDIVKKGSTDRSVTVRIIDSSDGTPETGVLYNTSGIDLWYRREGGSVVSITEAELSTPAVDDAHADGGFIHISDGEYRLDLPDAAFATGANHVDIGGTVTGMVVIGGRVRLVDYDPEDTVRLGLTALPNAVPAGSGGLPTVDANNRLAGIQGTLNTLDALDTVQDTQHAATQSGVAGVQSTASAVETDTQDIQARLPSALVSGRIDASVGAVAAGAITSTAIADNAITAAKVADGFLTAAKFAAGAFDAVWSVTARLLTAGTNIVLAKGVGVTGFNDVSASEVADAVWGENINDHAGITESAAEALVDGPVAALASDTYGEPGQGAPGATVSLADKIGFLYKAWRNRHSQTADTYRLYGDDAVTVDQKATVSDDGSTFERTEIGTGP